MRLISFGMTLQQFEDGSKDVTRRLGWRTLEPGTLLRAVHKVMGFRKGERPRTLGVIRVVSVRRELLSHIACYPANETAREGFPDLEPWEFVLMFCKAQRCDRDQLVTRIEFVKLSPAERDAALAADLHKRLAGK